LRSDDFRNGNKSLFDKAITPMIPWKCSVCVDVFENDQGDMIQKRCGRAPSELHYLGGDPRNH
jgi:hypothetical protein